MKIKATKQSDERDKELQPQPAMLWVGRQVHKSLKLEARILGNAIRSPRIIFRMACSSATLGKMMNHRTLEFVILISFWISVIFINPFMAFRHSSIQGPL